MDRLLPLTGAPVSAVDRLTYLKDTQELIKELLVLSKQRMAARRNRDPPVFQPNDLVYLSTRGLNIRSQKCKHLRDQNLGPFRVVERVGLNSYRLHLPKGMQLHPVFHCDLLTPSQSSTPSRAQPTDIEGDEQEYPIDYIADVKVDSWPRRRGPYLQFLTHFVGYDAPEWMLLEQVDDCEQLSTFLQTDVWENFARGEVYHKFQRDRPNRDIKILK